MRLCIFTEPQQGASFADQLRVAQRTEENGFDAFFRSDHYLSMGGTGLPGPTDSWVTLGGIALQTSRIRLGTLVTSATFRLPAPLAVSVAQVDEMSGGRVEFGLGSGWFEAEHTAYGIPFPPVGERFDRYEEQLEIITGLWGTPAGETYSYSGRHYQLKDSPALPKPVQSPMPIIIGGSGKKRTPALAARYAAEYNVAFVKVPDAGLAFDRVRAACAEAGRAELPTLSAAVVLCVGRNDAEVRRRAAAIGRDVEEMRGNGGAAGTPEQVIERIQEYKELGATRMFLQMLDLSDLDHLDLVASEIAPHV
ncbi:F420-dependent oxidoreductase-like protein [Catenuloplanes nepalensis]|uniref:F420-dependent oxidoreductase-like protein n=1 Tax=Catenuloplanes nepalensis TaxID=587533 RepID=A0ABT9N022_9ACTN|nr:LLM class F420-dependent oxidoreductase [Catenuloplanes nepalensis]MDP9797039.1 F420-dependent oxidoreductase-like protein [Catenuloplanes nepalensis]